MIRRPAPVRLVLAAAWVIAAGTLGACDYFMPTEPEKPNKPAITTNYKIPTLALETIAKGVEAKAQSNGQDAYMAAFAESALANSDGAGFHAFFDPLDLRAHESTWNPARDDWNRDRENRFYGQLVSQLSYSYEMTWEPYEPAGNESGGTEDSLLHRKYTIMYLQEVNQIVTRKPLVIGAADLHFVKSARRPGDWVIASWQDFRVPGADTVRTLGKLRLEHP